MAHAVTLPDDLAERASRSAEERGVNLDEMIRIWVEAWLRDVSYDNDPFISDREVYTGPTPGDLVANHDKYLYGEDE
ncbi:MAG TPA: CopG family transcriptional regulator [Thermoanaerobaculia bacterium]|nr:CopG family transcriptional regulator [Thermoanaerobaculia bacterium]